MASVATARRIRPPRTLTAERLATPLALTALAGVVVLGLLIALQAAGGRTGLIPASWHGLPGWMRGPLPGVGPGLHGEEFAELFVWMCACYLVVLALATRVSAALAIGAVVTLHLAFLLAPPLLSADVFGYIDWARIGATHGLDPYSHGSLDAIGDPVFRYMRWHTHMGSPYGPLFTIGSYALAPLGVAASFWAFKSLAALASLAIVAFTWGCAKRLGRAPVPALLLVGLNPLVLSWAVAGAHNDLLAVAVMMGAVYLALGARERASGAVAICAAAMKASTGVVLPFMFAGARPATR